MKDRLKVQKVTLQKPEASPSLILYLPLHLSESYTQP